MRRQTLSFLRGKWYIIEINPRYTLMSDISAAMNWIEQSVNCLGQALLLGGVYALHRAGLRECRQL